MGGAGWLFLFSVLMAAGLLFTMVFFIIMFSDLECDYINPIDLCNKLNQFVLPENIAHAFLTILFLLSGQWVAFLLNLPLVLYNANKIRNKNHMYDATEIFRTLSGHKKESFMKLGFYLLSFFYYLYRLVVVIPIAVALESRGNKGHKLGKKFTQLSAGLRKHAQGSGSKLELDPYWRIQEEWQSAVHEIRDQDGFSRFLLPPRFEDLQQAAECGPVIIVNASKYTCDALIILRTSPPLHVPLDCSLDDVIQLCSQFSELIEDPHAYGGNREFWLKRSLRDLWTTVVERIVTVLPLHAAGPYRKDKTLMDIYISSYAPSFWALVRVCERARSQQEICDAAGTANAVISFAAVGQAQPSMPVIDFEHAVAALNVAVVESAKEVPLEKRIVSTEIPSSHSFLPVIIADVGDDSTPDEVPHLSGAIPFAAFNQVIGTPLWVDESTSCEVVTRFYREVLKHQEINLKCAAGA
ncbi:cornichon protein-domain-containing protein [Lanmaoa asiatica]|nr:cornichon protein-domain-containing protein [Lanmaoa asiatica]